MDKGKLNTWIKVAGNVAVVASLVFVGLQLKQSQEIAIASQYQARLESASGHYTALLQSDPALRAMGKDILADIMGNENLPPEFKAWAQAQPVEELAFRVVGAVLFLKSHDNVYFQYQEGFLSEEAWEALKVQLKMGLDDPRSWIRSVYLENPMVWRESYRELIEGMM